MKFDDGGIILNTDISSTEPVFTIGIVAKLLDISPESIRLYDRENLIIPHRTKTDRRLFSKLDIEWMKYFRQFISKNTVTIKDIHYSISNFPCHELKHCSKSAKTQCSAYNNPDLICWSATSCPNRRPERNYCHECDVYKNICEHKNLDFKSAPPSSVRD
jgi:DNA-binding transcriptional MerR regulator